jgi:hypothetical protein
VRQGGKERAYGMKFMKVNENMIEEEEEEAGD